MKTKIKNAFPFYKRLWWKFFPPKFKGWFTEDNHGKLHKIDKSCRDGTVIFVIKKNK